MSTNHLKDIAIVGATGQQGTHIVNALLATGKHSVTAITRSNSTATPADGVKVAPVDYDSHDSLVTALTGIDCLIITMAVTAPPDTHSKLVRAAADAKVKWLIPDEWGCDNTQAQYAKDSLIGPPKLAQQKLMQDLGLNWTGVACGPWYEYSLAIPSAYGFDIQNKEAVLFDDGNQKINTSTWEQAARAVVSLLSLPIGLSDKSEKQVTLETHFHNRLAYVSSFLVSQNDMLASLKRVTGTSDADWKVTREDSSERVGLALEALKGGDRMGFMKNLYTRTFFPDGAGDFESRWGLDNEALGLSGEDLDYSTRRAVERNAKASEGGH